MQMKSVYFKKKSLKACSFEDECSVDKHFHNLTYLCLQLYSEIKVNQTYDLQLINLL